MKYFGLVLFTIIEAATLAGWLALTGRNQILALGVLLVGLILEHVISYNYRNGFPLFDFQSPPFGKLIGLAAVETVAWAGWLALVAVNGVLAAVVLFVALILGHGAELNIVRQLPAFASYRSRLKSSLDITAIETIAGVAWLAFVQGKQAYVGLGLLFILLLLEHFISGRKRVAP
jgi:hypothetical protein